MSPRWRVVIYGPRPTKKSHAGGKNGMQKLYELTELGAGETVCLQERGERCWLTREWKGLKISS